MPQPFVHLRVHSDYSLGRGASKLKSLVKKAVSFGQPAMALTDESNLYGALEFSKAAQSSGMQPIMGADIQFATGLDNGTGSVILLAQSAIGYANICRIVNTALDPNPLDPSAFDVDAPEFKPNGEHKAGIFDIERVKFLCALAHHAGDIRAFQDVIAIAGGGPQGFFATAKEPKDVFQRARMLTMLMPGRVYIEICRNDPPSPQDFAREKLLLETALKINLPIVATSDVWYDVPTRHRAFELLKAVNEGKEGAIVTHEDDFDALSPVRHHLRSSEEMAEIFADLPEAYENASAIATRCGFTAHARDPILPPFQTEGGRTEAEELRLQSEAGLEDRFEALSIPEAERPSYRERLAFELNVIVNMKFPGYFLIVGDFIKWAKAQGIPVGPGRGSGAGSVVAWSLTITDLDPIRFGLLFERFLNPDRVSMPDFDIDFCQDRRGEVIEYVGRKYGRTKVAQIATFMGIKSKMAIKDAARVTKTIDSPPMRPTDVNILSALIPAVEGKKTESVPLREAFEKDERFRRFVTSDPVKLAAFKNALEIEGLYRNASAHAAGVIIAGDRLTTLVPAGFDVRTGFPVVQFNMKDAETAGLVKFDFLGLTTLSVLRLALDYIRELYGLEIDLSTLAIDDRPTYEMLAEGRSNGVFQFESEGMKRALISIKPTVFEDLIAVAALFRPGPMEMIPTYAAVKNGEMEADYPEPVEKTSKILAETHGIMVYQEQVMQVAQAVAGYTLGQADLLRRAMGKKIREEMEKQEAGFVEGAFGQGLPRAKGKELFDLIKKFADYGFNKSHAAAYAMIAYHTAYLKRHYPAAFFAAIMTYDSHKPDKLALYKQDMDLFGVPLLPPDVNMSLSQFRPEVLPDGKVGIRFGLKAIKNVAAGAGEVVKIRGDRPYTSLDDFYKRAGSSLDSSELTKLVEAGAFDSISDYTTDMVNWLRKSSDERNGAPKPRIAPGAKRGVINRNLTLEHLKGTAKSVSKVNSAQGGLDFAELETDFGVDFYMKPNWGNIASREFEATGFFFTSHPLEIYEKSLPYYGGVRRRASIIKWMLDPKKPQGLLGSHSGAKILGLITDYNERPNKNGYPHIHFKFAERSDTYLVRWSPPQGDAGRIEYENMAKLVYEAKKNKWAMVVASRIAWSDYVEDYMIHATEVITAQQYEQRCNIQAMCIFVANTTPLVRSANLDAFKALLVLQAELTSAPVGSPEEAVILSRMQQAMASIEQQVVSKLTADIMARTPIQGEKAETIAVEFVYRDATETVRDKKLIVLPGQFSRVAMESYVQSDRFGIIGNGREVRQPVPREPQQERLAG